jgi:hypothetical protein
MNIILAGRLHINEETGHGSGWELLGLYTEEAKAKLRCTGKFDFVAGPLEIDVDFPEEVCKCDIHYFPNLNGDWVVSEINPNLGKSCKVEI